MAVHLRLTRRGSKKRPSYRLVAADVRDPRDGDFIETLGNYEPRLPKDRPDRFKYDEARVRYWLSVGAKPTETVAKQLRKDGLWNEPAKYKPKPRTKLLPPRAQARKDAQAAAQAEAAESAAQG